MARTRAYLAQPHWWLEIAIVWSIFQAYSYVRNLGGKEVAPAFANGSAIEDLQERLHLAIEMPVNQWVNTQRLVADLSSVHYHTLHWWVTIGVAVWLYRTNRPAYRRASLVLAFTTLTALVGFYLIPTAPPRMYAGYHDILAQTASWGWWESSGSPGPESITNQFAAMPSLHCGWAIWAGLMIAIYARRTWVRVLGVVYPLTTFFVVVGTANHWILDIVVVAVIIAVAMVVVYRPWRQAAGAAVPEPAAERSAA
ncbi:phosphatase PAP2 family protein [Gordonia sp. LSe1-13]|uniref:Phosphatase PAP2 family protein n=2 Tax=Gordonia TaxID=2053 RepID=A0ABU7M786_9ACTN|nr:phosphatase PAP2 family protein [Gordonia sp. LSe1-13]MEE4022317.1 phosphatase PAP2 family protein [Gordonia sp. PKS22-38]